MASILLWITCIILIQNATPGSSQDSPDDAETSIRPYLLLANTFDIRRLNFDGTNYQFLSGGLTETKALDYDYSSGQMYFSHTVGETKKISRAPLETGSPIEDIIVSNLGSPDGLAVDWVNRKLFWTDGALNLIEKSNIDGSQRGVLISSGTHKPRGIVLDPHQDYMYFTDIGTAAPSIQRARMSDGYYRQIIVNTDLLRPNGLTIDYEESTLYFVDAQTDKIESCNLDGTNRRVILDRPSTFHPFSISVFEDRLYWSDLLQHHIMHCDKETGASRVRMEGYFAYPTALHVVHPSRQLLANRNWCEANEGLGSCQHICENLYDDFKCSCLPGFEPVPDDPYACQDINECSIGNGGCNHRCANTEGSFQCECIGGFDLLPDGLTCADLNECHTNNGGCQYTCHNTDTGYYCSCPAGLMLTATDRHQCGDIDECSTQHPCPSDGYCSNVEGSYTCHCPEGYHYEGVSNACVDLDECRSGASRCGQVCINLPGTYRCECHSGFTAAYDGVSCMDINECDLYSQHAHTCDQRCTNIIGSYICSCLNGFVLNSDQQTCSVIDCGQPSAIPGFSLSCHGSNYGNTCSLSCEQGQLLGNPVISCQSNGLWSTATAECITSTPTSGDENQLPLQVYLSSNTIPEDASIGAIVGTLNTIDSDTMQTFTYSLTSGDVDVFRINSDDNTLRTKVPLNFESTSSYTVSITSTDSGTPPLSVTSDLSVVILNVNEQPTTPTLTNTFISEDAKPGVTVGTLQASDPDDDSAMTFALLNSADGTFDLEDNKLILAKEVNFEARVNYYITVLVTDSGQPPLTNTASLNIQLYDRNDPPTDITLTTDTVHESTSDGGATRGTIIGDLTTDDEDTWDSHTYTLTGENNACFNISGATLLVNDVLCFDYESAPVVDVTMTSIDRGLKSIQRTLNVKLIDAEEAPTGITLSSSIVREHAPVGTVVGVLTVQDPDQGDTHTFFIGAHETDAFRIQGNKLVVQQDISHSDFPSGILLGLAVSDRADKIFSQNYAIHVQDINDPPGEITWEVMQMCTQDQMLYNDIHVDACVEEERSTSAVIATPMVTDLDGDTLIWTLLDSTESFSIEADGTLRVASRRISYEDFEKTSHGPLTSVIIVATDPGGLSTSSQLNIRFLDINDAPRRVVMSNAYVASNTPIGQTVATLICDDNDSDDAHTFRFVYTVNEFYIFGNEVRVQTDLQEQAGQFISTYIACSDGETETDGGYLPIHIVDSGENHDVVLTQHPNYIVENSPANTVVGTVTAQSTLNPFDTYTFSLPDVYQEQFSLRPRLGEADANHTVDVIALQPFDYENDSLHEIVIEAATVNSTAVQHFTITVLNINEPVENIAFTPIDVPENKIGVLAGIISATDPEVDDIDFEITDDQAGAFQLLPLDTPNARKLVTSRALDYESESTLTITISVTDPSGSTQPITNTFQVRVANVNEAPSGITPIRFEVEENSVAMTTVGSLVVDDVDSAHSPQRFECQMKDDGGGLFTVDGTDIRFQVASGAVLDYESFPVNHKSVTITVECYDQGQLSVTADIDMVITDINEPPTDIISQSGGFEIEENNSGGSTVATLLTLDPESPDPAAGTFTYRMAERPLDFPFAIIGDRVIAHQRLNYEDTNMYYMHITTTDSGGLSFSKTIRINVIDGNDTPTSIVLATTAKIYEHSDPGTPICTLTAIDEDINQEHYFTIESHTLDGALQIFNGTQLVVGNADIDNETWSTVSVTLKVTDVGSAQSGLYVESFTLDIEDVNEPPTGIQLSSSTIVENPSAEMNIAQVIIDDPDEFDQTFFCYLVYQGSSSFNLNHHDDDGIYLQIGHDPSGFDYEQSDSVTVTIWCRDSDPQFIKETFTIWIQDSNDPPTGLVFMDAEEGTATTNASQPDGPDIFGSVVTSQTVTIKEDAPSSVGVVCYIFVIDEDAMNGTEPAHQSAVVQLISESEYEEIRENSGSRQRRSDRIYSRHRRQTESEPWEISDDFVIQSGTNYLLVNKKLDHETTEEYMVYFKAYDPEIPDKVVASSLRVVILDVDEAPKDMMLSSTVVEENSPINNTKIGDLSVDDPDGTPTGYIFTMVSLGTPFFIIGNTLHVERHPLDYEVTPTISIQIQVKEIATSLALTKTFHINVTDIPEPPTSLTIDGNITIWVPETAAPPMSLGKIVSDDPDQYDETMTYSFFAQQPTEFEIQGDKLMLVGSLDSWQRRLFDLPMQVADSTGLTFRQVIFVRVAEEDRCEEKGYCSQYATCVHNHCQCKDGFTGDGFECVDHNECIPNPCDTKTSYGACENGIGGLRNFTCECKPGWTGADCTSKVDKCDDNQCHEEGTLECVNLQISYLCTCNTGFTGAYCEVNIDDCGEDHQCQNGGNCVDGISGYTCDCPKPFVGLQCETNSDLCDKVICPHNGTCIPIPNQSSTACLCLEPYAADCNGCAYGYGGPDCAPCPSPYTGVDCEIDPSVCYPNPCEDNMICVPYYKQYACICPANDSDTQCAYKPPIASTVDQVTWIHTTGGMTSLVVAIVALLALIVLLLGLLYCRKLRKPHRKPWGRARYRSESQAVIIDNQENGGVTDDTSWPSQYPPTAVLQRYNIRKVSNDIRQTTNASRLENGDPVADFVGAIAKPLSSRGRQISSTKKNNLGEWEKNNLESKDDNFDSLKAEKGKNVYVDMPQRELPVGALVFRNDQYRPEPVSPRESSNPSPTRKSPRRRPPSSQGDEGIEEDIASDNRRLQGNRHCNETTKVVDFLKDNPVFQCSEDEEEEEVPTSII